MWGIVGDSRSILENALPDCQDVPVIPVAGLSGENLVSKSAEMPWYAGHTAIESLDALGSMNRPAEARLRT